MDFRYFSRNGELLLLEEAAIPLSNIEYQYGFGVYETIRVAEGTPVFLKDHLERLMESADIIGLKHVFAATFVENSIAELIEKNGAGTYNTKILLIGGNEPVLFILCLNPLFPDKKLYRDGTHFITYEYERIFPHAKTLNMLGSYLAYKKAKEAGAYDALLLTKQGCITEGTRTNFFCLKDRTIVSPPENEILLGVTRKAALTAARRNGFTIEEKPIGLYDLEKYDGAFITSTSSKILPARSIDEHVFPRQPEALKDLIRAFDEFLEGEERPHFEGPNKF